MNHKEESTRARELWNQILAQLETLGCRGRIVSVNCLGDLQQDIERHKAAGVIDETLTSEYLSSFEFEMSPNEAGRASVIVIAAPAPFLRITFASGGRGVPVVIPPTYCHRIDGEIEKLLSEVLSPAGHWFSSRILPKKLLAARCGLARFGRNNLAYVDGMGSYCRLISYLTDITCGEHDWKQPSLLDECDGCQTCRKKCFTGAIGEDRFLIRAEKCLTFHNERSAEFPSWIDPAWHHCLVGCLYCQIDCPVNRKAGLQIEEGPTFDEAETNIFLRGESPQQETPAYRRLFDVTGLLHREDLARNLRALLHGSGNAERAMKLVRG